MNSNWFSVVKATLWAKLNAHKGGLFTEDTETGNLWVNYYVKEKAIIFIRLSKHPVVEYGYVMLGYYNVDQRSYVEWKCHHREVMAIVEKSIMAYLEADLGECIVDGMFDTVL